MQRGICDKCGKYGLVHQFKFWFICNEDWKLVEEFQNKYESSYEFTKILKEIGVTV